MYGGIGVDVTFRENGCEGESVVAVDEVVMHVVDLCGELIKMGNGQNGQQIRTVTRKVNKWSTNGC